jgi:hypothetical protein
VHGRAKLFIGLLALLRRPPLSPSFRRPPYQGFFLPRTIVSYQDALRRLIRLRARPLSRSPAPLGSCRRSVTRGVGRTCTFRQLPCISGLAALPVRVAISIVDPTTKLTGVFCARPASLHFRLIPDARGVRSSVPWSIDGMPYVRVSVVFCCLWKDELMGPCPSAVMSRDVKCW